MSNRNFKEFITELESSWLPGALLLNLMSDKHFAQYKIETKNSVYFTINNQQCKLGVESQVDEIFNFVNHIKQFINNDNLELAKCGDKFGPTDNKVANSKSWLWFTCPAPKHKSVIKTTVNGTNLWRMKNLYLRPVV